MKMKIEDIKPNLDNPRFIKDASFKKLVTSIKELPVMTGLREVIIDKNNVVIGGNMRYRAAKEAGWSEIDVKMFTEEMALENNKLTGKNKSYEDYVREIIIKDNVSGGEWDYNLLANEWKEEELEQWGVDLPVDKLIDDLEEDEEIEFEQSIQIEPPEEYILVKCPPNSLDFEDMKERLQLKIVKRGGYKKGSPFDVTGLERVIDWQDFKKRLGL
jgi:hypothetical protein